MNKIKNLNNNSIEFTVKPQISKKLITVQKSIKEAILEKAPISDCLDLSMEEFGIIMSKDANGKIVKVVKTVFPR